MAITRILGYKRRKVISTLITRIMIQRVMQYLIRKGPDYRINTESYLQGMDFVRETVCAELANKNSVTVMAIHNVVTLLFDEYNERNIYCCDSSRCYSAEISIDMINNCIDKFVQSVSNKVDPHVFWEEYSALESSIMREVSILLKYLRRTNSDFIAQWETATRSVFDLPISGALPTYACIAAACHAPDVKTLYSSRYGSVRSVSLITSKHRKLYMNRVFGFLFEASVLKNAIVYSPRDLHSCTNVCFSEGIGVNGISELLLQNLYLTMLLPTCDTDMQSLIYNTQIKSYRYAPIFKKFVEQCTPNEHSEILLSKPADASGVFYVGNIEKSDVPAKVLAVGACLEIPVYCVDFNGNGIRRVQ